MARAMFECLWANVLVGLMLVALAFVYFVQHQMLGGPDWAPDAARGFIERVCTNDDPSTSAEMASEGAQASAASDVAVVAPFDVEPKWPATSTWLGLYEDDLQSVSDPPQERAMLFGWYALSVVSGLALGALVAARALLALRRRQEP